MSSNNDLSAVRDAELMDEIANVQGIVITDCSVTSVGHAC